MADHDQQYLIEMDGNQTASTLFKVSLVTFVLKLNTFKAMLEICSPHY